jgi:hypothetical protein
MLKEKYEFDLTVAQRCAIRDACVSEVEVSFTTGGVVTATVFEEYEIVFYTFRKDGEVVREVRDFGSGGWVTWVCGLDNVWRDEEGEEIE